MKKIQRIWSNKIISVLSYFKINPGSVIFGVTGDIDNLGIFVAKNGRPMAENLVDVYNHLIGIFLYNYFNKNKEIRSFCIIPSGEEIFVLGVADDRQVVEEFFNHLHREFNIFLFKNVPKEIYNSKVSVSFGCSILNAVINIEQVIKLLEAIKLNNFKDASNNYLDLMLIIRTELAYDLDIHKFKSLNVGNIGGAIFFRNLVNYHLLKYKKETQENLCLIATWLKEIKNSGDIVKIKNRNVFRRYGLGVETEGLLFEFLKKIL